MKRILSMGIPALRCLTVLVLLGNAPAWSEVKPHGLFSEGMVLQQGMPVPVWGTADDGEEVTVRLCGQEASTTAADGKWMVRLQPLKAGGPFEMTIVGTDTITIGNVLVGEVWLCSGQSNMAMTVNRAADADAVAAASANPQLRLLTVPTRGGDEPLRDLPNAKWKEAGPDSVPSFSAVGYFFGKALQEALKVPVGLINSSVGGTPAEAWTSLPAMKAVPELQGVFERYATAVERFPKAQEQFEKKREQWREAVKKAREEGTPIPRGPRPPMGPDNPKRPGGLYYGKITPLQPYAIRGATWYQGEGNSGRAYEYRTLLPTMIKCWRNDWGQGEFPFLVVQLAPFRAISEEPEDSAWAELREAQLYTTQTVPKTGLAVITDVGEEKDIHPKKKQPVGQRLALAARALAYGEQIEYAGPVYDSLKVAGGKAVLSFTHLGGGLVCKGDKLTGFTIAGADKQFVNAEAKIEGDTVVVWSDQVAEPASVRFGWANFPVVNLWNKAGLPASPFRTDEWPGVTWPKPEGEVAQ